jgi:hypothetical protein
MTYQPFKVGQRVRRIKTGDTGKVVGVFQVQKDQYRNRFIRGRWKSVVVHKKGRWLHKIDWDATASADTQKYKWWMAVEWLEAIEDSEQEVVSG